MFKRIAHTAYIVSDMNKALEFYCGVLGCEVAFELNDDNGKPWIVYLKIADFTFIELFYSKNSFEPKGMWKNEGYGHLCLETDDIYKTAETITKNGGISDVPPNQGKDLNYQCWIHDPDGNAIEIMQMHPDSPQLKE